jgi:hypothetical protein
VEVACAGSSTPFLKYMRFTLCDCHRNEICWQYESEQRCYTLLRPKPEGGHCQALKLMKSLLKASYGTKLYDKMGALDSGSLLLQRGHLGFCRKRSAINTLRELDL